MSCTWRYFGRKKECAEKPKKLGQRTCRLRGTAILKISLADMRGMEMVEAVQGAGRCCAGIVVHLPGISYTRPQYVHVSKVR